MNDIVINATDLCRDYGQFRALDKASLSIAKDRIVALLGPNGAGKTTFLHLVMGLLEPTEGNATVLGADSRKMSKEIVAQIGYMGDGDEPPGWVTAKKLIAMQRESSARFDTKFIKKFLADRELCLNKSFGSMSKGQKKWVRAGLVLASMPKVLILDEPAEGLDPSARHELYDCLREYITDSGATAVVATHIIGDIERIADDVAVIHKGKVVTHACLEDLRDEVSEIHLSENELPASITDDFELIGKKEVADGRLFWVRSTKVPHEELKNLLGEQSHVRRIDLQTFYLAITENNHNSSKES
jgi:ABC-2 type transport system ATP-binding protein